MNEFSTRLPLLKRGLPKIGYAPPARRDEISEDPISQARFETIYKAQQQLSPIFDEAGVNLGFGLFGSLRKGKTMNPDDKASHESTDVDLVLFLDDKKGVVPFDLSVREKIRDGLQKLDAELFEDIERGEHWTLEDTVIYDGARVRYGETVVKFLKIFIARKIFDNKDCMVTDLDQVEHIFLVSVQENVADFREFFFQSAIHRDLAFKNFWLKVLFGKPHLSMDIRIFQTLDIGGVNSKIIQKFLKIFITEIITTMRRNPLSWMRYKFVGRQDLEKCLDEFARTLAKVSYAKERFRQQDYILIPKDSRINRFYPQTFQQLLNRYNINRADVMPSEFV